MVALSSVSPHTKKTGHPAMGMLCTGESVLLGTGPAEICGIYPHGQVSHAARGPNPRITARRLVRHPPRSCFGLPAGSLKLADGQAGFSPASLPEKDEVINSSATHCISSVPPVPG